MTQVGEWQDAQDGVCGVDSEAIDAESMASSRVCERQHCWAGVSSGVKLWRAGAGSEGWEQLSAGL